MKKIKLFGRGAIPQVAPAAGTVPATVQKYGYADLFLSNTGGLQSRQSVYISRETHASVNRLVHLLAMAGTEISIGKFIDNVLEHHFNTFQDDITELYDNNLRKPF